MKFLLCFVPWTSLIYIGCTQKVSIQPKICLNKVYITVKSLSEALIFASTNPQYDDRLFIELQVQYMKIPNSNLGRTCCEQKLFLTFRTFFVHNLFFPCSAKRRASDKDIPVLYINCLQILTSVAYEMF